MQRFDLDDLDRTIIGLLTEDGRLSASEIAGKIGGVSERTVRNRITALLQSRMIVIGAIPQITAIVAPIIPQQQAPAPKQLTAEQQKWTADIQSNFIKK